ncbi:uncharacterized protein LOC115426649 isoform X2 [Sphaeramia orbicularis]|uniref:uncharacterized protein LOC115426649 isoform X2 n=1 Tax=Sphaeramia orbicularis TaxID=375764 RepID=UPI00117DD161|nr:uncharacterized protein LOC115426649 isoform X2 [Sphaeramia orbicularis]
MKSISTFYCLLCATWASASTRINAEGPEGGEVSFKCSHSVASPYTKYLCKDPCKANEDKLVSVKSGGSKMEGRIVLEDSGDGAFTVTFTKLQLSDTGKYWCAVARPGFDTYIEIHLSVKEADQKETVTNATTFVTSPTWTNQSVTSSSELIFHTDTSANSSQATVLYSTIGAIALLIILLLIIRFKKCKGKSRPQPCNRTNLNMTENQNNYDVGVDIATQDPPMSASTAEESATPVYENIGSSKPRPPVRPRDSAGNSQNNHDTYIIPLPTVSYKRQKCT